MLQTSTATSLSFQLKPNLYGSLWNVILARRPGTRVAVEHLPTESLSMQSHDATVHTDRCWIQNSIAAEVRIQVRQEVDICYTGCMIQHCSALAMSYNQLLVLSFFFFFFSCFIIPHYCSNHHFGIVLYCLVNKIVCYQ